MMSTMKNKFVRAMSVLWLIVATVVLPSAYGAEVDDMVFFQNDHLGSAIAAVNEYGDLCWTESYSPYGEKTLNEDIGFGMPAGCGLLGQERGYTSHTADFESGLTYAQQRYYDPSIGRFLSVDPLSADPYDDKTFNRYSYAANNPYRYTDPTGEAYGDPTVPDDSWPSDLNWNNSNYDWNNYYDSENSQSVANALDRHGEQQDEWLAGTEWHPVEWVIGGGAAAGSKFASFMKGLFGGKVPKGAKPDVDKSLGNNPFKGKTKEETAEMFEEKGFKDKGANPLNGQGTYVNPKTGRGYHIDAGHKPPKGPHVGVHRPRGKSRETLKSRDYSLD